MKTIIFVYFVLFTQLIHSDTKDPLNVIKDIKFDRMELEAVSYFEFKVESETIGNECKQTIVVKTNGADLSILLISVTPDLYVQDIRSTESGSGSTEKGAFNSHGFSRRNKPKPHYKGNANYKYNLRDNDRRFMIYIVTQRIGAFDVKPGDRFDANTIKKIKAALPSYWDDGKHVLLGKIKICDVRARWSISAKEIDLSKSNEK